MKNVFMEATRKKMRFPFSKGMLTTEDLWDLKTEQLNEIYMELKSRKKEDGGLIPTSNTEYNDEIDTQLEVIRCVYDTKVTEAKNHESDEVRRQQKEKIKAILKEREDDNLRGLSDDELKEMLKD